jgi:co-chaperonin GroES (HSP10)
MNINLFGPRCLVEFHRIKSASKILIPDSAQERDSHRFGIVRYIGDGKLKGKPEPKPALVKEGDVVMFQINNIMEATQKFVLDGKTYMNLLQDELIARVIGEDVTADNLEMLGEYALLQHFLREQIGSKLLLPDSAQMRTSSPDFIYFRCIKKGSLVDKAVNVGDEVVVNFGRLTPMFITRRNDDGTSTNLEYVYTRNDWIDGVVVNPAAAG